MELRQSVVHRNLDSKLKIFGFEFFDLLAVLSLSAIMNVIFGSTPIGFVMVFVVPAVLALILFFGKRNKPDDYLIHAIRFYSLPGAFAPGNEPSQKLNMQRKIYHE